MLKRTSARGVSAPLACTTGEPNPRTATRRYRPGQRRVEHPAGTLTSPAPHSNASPDPCTFPGRPASSHPGGPCEILWAPGRAPEWEQARGRYSIRARRYGFQRTSEGVSRDCPALALRFAHLLLEILQL